MILTNLLVLITIYFLTIILAEGETTESTGGEKEGSEETKTNSDTDTDTDTDTDSDSEKTDSSSPKRSERTVKEEVDEFTEITLSPKSIIAILLLSILYWLLISLTSSTIIWVAKLGIASLLLVIVHGALESGTGTVSSGANFKILGISAAITITSLLLLTIFSKFNFLLLLYLWLLPAGLIKVAEIWLISDSIVAKIISIAVLVAIFFVALGLGESLSIAISSITGSESKILNNPSELVSEAGAKYGDILEIKVPNFGLTFEEGFDRAENKVGNTFKDLPKDLLNALLGKSEMSKVKNLGPIPAYYAGKVDDGQQKKVGVFIENAKLMTDQVFTGEPIYLTANLVGSSFLDKPIRAYTSCRLTKNDFTTEGTTDPAVVELDYNMPRTVTCELPRVMQKGFYTAAIGASFNFETWAYITYTFVDRKIIYNYNSQHKDINKELSINPLPRAIYTNGPVKIGISSTKQPIDVNTNTANTDDAVEQQFSFTIDNAWYQGSIKQINNITVMTPPDIRLEDCGPISYTREIPYTKNDHNKNTISSEKEKDSFNKYIFLLTGGSNGFDSRVSYKTINCKIRLSSDAINEIGLSSKTLATFIIKVNYDYSLEKKLSVPVRE